MTRFVRFATVIAAAATLATIQTTAAAQGRGGAGGRLTGSQGPGPMPMLRGLNLSEGQREQVRSIVQAQRGSKEPFSADADLHRQLQLALFSDTPDQGKIEELKASIATAQARRLTNRIDVESRIAQVLTPEQRAQARDALSKVGPRNGPPGGRRGRAGRL